MRKCYYLQDDGKNSAGMRVLFVGTLQPTAFFSFELSKTKKRGHDII